MSNFFEALIDILKADERFFAEDGTLLRNRIYEASMAMDKNLIKLLLGNDNTKKRFFTEVEDVFVFDKVGFGWVINNRQFLPDSYTRYKNRIGLTDSRGDLISTSDDVVLSFPYKDCVLAGGQTSDDQKRDEVFFNATLSSDEVDRLLYPKVLVNAKRYTADGVEKNIKFDNTDNLIIKGNNLLAISSLLKRYEGKVKCIYIDVPYNTGNDSFRYNDKFNHSSWLTFMKNRLEIAHRLLKREGTIAISVDNYEIAYLLVLLDEIFGKENRKNIITVKRGSVTGAKVINPGVVNIVEYVILYSKNAASWKPNRAYSAKGYDDRYNNFINNFDDGYENWSFTTVLEAWSSEVGVKKSALKRHFGDSYAVMLEDFVIENANRIVRLAVRSDADFGQAALPFKRKSEQNPDSVVLFERGENDLIYIKNGQVVLFAKDRIQEIDDKHTFSEPVSDIWDDVLPNDLHNEGGIEFKKGKKPEKLLQRIIELCTSEGDIVVDFFAGSGTTGAVAQKMKRQYILCEQMEYIETITSQRIINVLKGETRGVSSDIKWQGGGSFIFCELARCNQLFIDELEPVTTSTEVATLLERVLKTGFISSKVDRKDIDPNAADFIELSLDDKKCFVMELLDMNMLYVNLSDIDDADYAISEADKTFTQSFYGTEGK
jgi:adenine-specific DNA-methyltransferase